MKAIQLQNYGDVDQFRVTDIKAPVPGAGEILIRVEVSGLNPVDAAVRQGWLARYVPLEFPATIGRDAAGTVVSTGAGVDGFAAGDRVIALLPINGKGAHAELVVVPASGAARLPDAVDFTAGATLPLAGLTGRQAVDALGVKPGNRVLVTGALGAVGRAAVQYLKELGAVPVAGVRAERMAEGKALAGEAIDLTAAQDARAFDFAVGAADALAGEIVKFVRDGGTIASVVMTPADANPEGRVNIVQIMAHEDPAQLKQVAEAAGRGELTIPVAETFMLDNLHVAHQALGARPRGKIVVVH